VAKLAAQFDSSRGLASLADPSSFNVSCRDLGGSCCFGLSTAPGDYPGLSRQNTRTRLPPSPNRVSEWRLARLSGLHEKPQAHVSL
jgi:hypothetical protein